MEKITQKEAVQRAIAAGYGMPKEGVVYIQATFGMELSTQAFSTLKTQLKGGSGTKGKKRGRPAGSVNGTSAPPKSKGTDLIDLARQVKSLVSEHGASAVKGMVDVFSD